MSLSIVLTHVSDKDLTNTLKSIRDTAGDEPELIVVDDLSGTPIEATCPNLHLANKVIRNRHRVGVGPSRHIGVMNAESEFVLFGDSHLRFPAGWLEIALARLQAHPKTIFCTTCIGLDSTHMQLSSPAALYYGARMNFDGIDPNNRAKRQVFEAVWNKQNPGDNAEIGAVMGGAYLCSKEWFLKLSALRYLRIWAMDEPMLSLSSWMAGGDCRLITAFGIGHVFLKKGERQPWTCPGGVTTYNKLFALQVLLPHDTATSLMVKLRAITDLKEFNYAQEMIKKDWHVVMIERERFQQMFTRDFGWYMDKFRVA